MLHHSPWNDFNARNNINNRQTISTANIKDSGQHQGQIQTSDAKKPNDFYLNLSPIFSFELVLRYFHLKSILADLFEENI